MLFVSAIYKKGFYFMLFVISYQLFDILFLARGSHKIKKLWEVALRLGETAYLSLMLFAMFYRPLIYFLLHHLNIISCLSVVLSVSINWQWQHTYINAKPVINPIICPQWFICYSTQQFLGFRECIRSLNVGIYWIHRYHKSNNISRPITTTEEHGTDHCHDHII
jgi:phosphotransferase system  glucose/maltose/N-acetylglucosamine-specific IIC component